MSDKKAKDRLPLDGKANNLLNEKWEALEAAQDAVIYAQGEFQFASLKSIKAAKKSPRHWGIIQNDGKWSLIKDDGAQPPRTEG